MNIAVIGGGRMGLPLACMFARHGANVVVGDIDAALVAQIAAGECPYEEPGLDELMRSMHAAGRLTATTSSSEAAAGAEVIVVIVPAHLTAERDIDLSILISASQDVGKGLRTGALVVYETTVAVGGTRGELVPALERASGLTAGVDFEVAYSPERVKANLVLERLETTPKVVGGLDANAAERACAVYRRFLGAPVENVGSIEAAEMTKLLGMLYRDVNIALANELAAFCEVVGVDFECIRSAANADGEANLLLPGIGVGGHCTPVYPYFLTRESRRRGITQRLSEAAREVNDGQPLRQVDRALALCGAVDGQRVHILGLGFRPGVKVDTFSPAYTLRDGLVERGARVTIEDPFYSQVELRDAGFEPGTAHGARVVVLNTAHEAFASLDFASLRNSGVEVVLDGRNHFDQAAVEGAGLTYFGVGRASCYEGEGAVTAPVAAPLHAVAG